MTTKPNVIMIVSDALRQDILGCYGGEARTPNIDWLAQNGVLFENAYATSPWTAPSAVSMFTGNYATTYAFAPFNRTMQISVPDSAHLLVEALREIGYDTRMKVENVQASIHNNLQGFEALPGAGIFDRDVPESTRVRVEEIAGRKHERLTPYKNSFTVVRHLMEIPSGVNFFLLHWILDPHGPYYPDDEFKSRITLDTSKLSKPRRFYSARRNFKGDLNDTERAYIRDLYIAEVESVDERVGFVLESLKRRGWIDNTYIIFTSDHGEQFGEHGLYGHGGFGIACNYYETLVKVPLLIAGPGLPAGKRVAAPVSHLDLMPTLKDLLGVEHVDPMQGQSYRPLMVDDATRRNPIYFDDVREHEHVDALLERPFKLIASTEVLFELYDLSQDGEEEDNIATSRRDIVESMYGKIVKIREDNQKRKKSNVAALGDSARAFSEEEKRELIRKLKALGYVN